VDGRGVVTVTKVSPPGPRAVHKRFFFSRDTRFLQRWLDHEYERTDAAEDYVGEWHRPPGTGCAAELRGQTRALAYRAALQLQD